MEIYNIEGSILCESSDVKSQSPKKIVISGVVMNENKISRNNVLYDWDTVKYHCKDLVGRPLLYNHLNEGNVKPIGHVTKSWVEGGTWHYEADVNPNSEYADSILRGDLKHVSIQLIAASAKPEKSKETGKSYTRAFVGDLLELSVVPTPGFIDASMEVALAEAFKNAIFKEDVENGEFGNFPIDSFHKGLKTELDEHKDLNPLEVAKLVIDHIKDNENYYNKPETKEEPELDILQVKDLWSRTREQDRVKFLQSTIENEVTKYVTVGWDQMPDFMKDMIHKNIKPNLSYLAAERFASKPDPSIVQDWQGNLSWKYYNDEYNSLSDENKKDIDEKIKSITKAFIEDVSTDNVPTGVMIPDKKDKEEDINKQLKKIINKLSVERFIEIYTEVFK